MSDNPNRRRAVYLGLSCGALAIVLAIAWCATVARRNHAAQRQAIWNSFVGIWATDGGVILQLRADGSARVRYPSSPSVPVSFFRWEIERGELLFVNSPRSPRTLKAMVYGLFDPSWAVKDDVDRFEIVAVTTDQADLISFSQDSGEAKYSTRWTRTDDATFDSAAL